MMVLLLLISCGEDPVEPTNHQSIQQWELLGLEGEAINAIAVDQFNENVIYAGSSSDFSAGKVGGVFKSNDNGTAWDTLVRGITVRDIDIHPVNSDIVFVTGGINYLTPQGLLKTIDGGVNWFRADTNLTLFPEEGLMVLAIDPLYPDTLYLGTGGVFGGKLYKSADGGQTWEAIGTDVDYLQDGITAIAIDPSNPDIIYVGTPWFGAILKSKDGGGSWNRLNFPEVGIINDLLVHPDNSKTVYAGTWGSGFYISRNSGESWNVVNNGLLDTSQVLKIDVSHTQIYAAVSFRDTGVVFTSYQDNINWVVVGEHGFKQRIRSVKYIYGSEKLLMGSSGIYMLAETQ